MNPKTILAVLHAKSDMEHVLDCALPLADSFGARLIGFHAEALPVPQATPMGFPDVELIRAGEEDARQRSSGLKTLFDERLRRDGTTAEWMAVESFGGDCAQAAARAARACDLIITQQDDPDDEHARVPDTETLLFESGRPVLFVPYAMPIEPRFRRVVVAWNGSAEAARAAFDALPFIVAAEQTEILCVDPRSTGKQDALVSGADIAEALSRHGAKVTLANEISGGLSAGEAIENHLAETGGDLLVMGAYSQSWWREFFFGGATRTLLSSMPVATLMSR